MQMSSPYSSVVSVESHGWVARRIALCIGSAMLLGACATGGETKGSIQAMQVVPIEDAPTMPTGSQLERAASGSRTRVVVLQPEEAQSSRGAGLPAQAVASLEQMLGQGVEIVDRKLATRMDAEIKRAEMLGTSKATYNGGDVADFAISVVMGVASYGSREEPATSYQDKKTGKVTNIARSFTHTARSNLTIRIHEMPSLRLVNSIPVESSITQVQQQTPITLAQAQELIRKATENGINENRAAVLNQFAPRGYATERRVKGDVSYFRTTLSRRTGAKPEQSVEIVRLQSSVDPLTKKTSINEAVIATGVVSDDLSDDHAYVAVKDAKEAASVRKGDVVRTKFDLSLTEQGSNFFKKMGL